MVAFWSTVQRLSLIILCWKSRVWVDFKINLHSSIKAGQQKENKNLYVAMKKW